MGQWTAGRVAANGIELHYHRGGGGPLTLLLLHGITDNGLCWARTADALAQDYDVILLDARGHGASDAPPSGYAPADHAADVAGVIAALGLDQPVLIGHSMGAETAARVAATYPDQVRALAVEDPPWWDVPQDEAQRAAEMDNWRAGIIDNRAKARQDILAAGRADNPGWHASEFEPWAEAKQQVSPDVVQFVLALDDWRATVRRITCPMLVITADPEAGALVTPEIAREVQQVAQAARVVRLRGAGHSIRRWQYAGYIAALRAFLDDVVAQSS